MCGLNNIILSECAGQRPLNDALLIRRGKRKGELAARVKPRRRVELIRLGHERALIYKMALLTGLRARELRTLRVRDISFGDVPFVLLNSAREEPQGLVGAASLRPGR